MEPRCKTCAVCKQRVHRGTGTYYAGRLVHKTCMEIAKIQRFKLHKRRAPRMNPELCPRCSIYSLVPAGTINEKGKRYTVYLCKRCGYRQIGKKRK